MTTSGSVRRLILAVMAVMLLAPLVAGGDEGGPEGWRHKVDRRVLQEGSAGPVEFLVVLDDQADLSRATALRDRAERGLRVMQTLRMKAAATQRPLIEALEQDGVPYRSYWIANMIWVRGGETTLRALASRAEVRRIDANPEIALSEPRVEPRGDATWTGGVTEWNILKVLAPQVWALGYDGSGIVIGGQDTGYDWDHPALKGKYRGWDGQSTDHDYNWHDSIHSGGGSCGADSPFPCDDYGHGTHTMGTMVGDDGGANQIGMSPGSTWIACRNMDQGTGTPATYAECFEWFVAPTDVNGENPDPSRAPHVINNSWTCPIDEGCAADTLQAVVENTRAAGIVVVASAGNDGSDCSSLSKPSAIYGAAFSVGATTSSDSMASFSSRGPVTVDGSGRVKPDVSAPGVGVRSCVPGGGYASYNGTSMAGPHVAGLVALLLDARPDLIGRVGEIEGMIEAAAVRINSAEACGGIPGTEFPNNTYGHGRIDALETVLGDADDDGADNLTDCRPIDPNAWAAPVPVDDLSLAQFGTETLLSWSAPAEAGAGVLRYDLLRSESADDFSSAICLRSFQASSEASDDAVPESLFYYLVRIRNACADSLGSDSSGSLRSGVACLQGDF